MGAGEGREHQVSRIGHPLVDFHAREPLIGLPHLHDMGEVQAAVHAVAHHVHRHGDDVHVSRALSVAEQRPLHPVRPGQDAELRVADAAAPVIVGMDAQNYVLPVFQMLVHIFYLAGKDMGHGHLHRAGQIDYGLVVSVRLPYVQHRVADLQGVLRLGLGEALRAVLEGKAAVRLLRHLL